MGISGQSGAANYRILDARYALMNCLSVSAAGELYQGRDLERLDGSGAESRVLIHIMPTNWSATFHVEAAFRDLCVKVQTLNAERVLPVLDHGTYGMTHYFVLESPPERNLQVLSKVTTDLTRLQIKAINWLEGIQSNGVIGLAAGLLLVTAEEEFYITATNLLSGVGQDPSMMGVNATVARPAPPRFTGRQFGFAGLLSLGAMAAAASAVSWYNHGINETLSVSRNAVANTTTQPAVAASSANLSIMPMDATDKQAMLADVPSHAPLVAAVPTSHLLPTQYLNLSATPEPVTIEPAAVQRSLAAFEQGNTNAMQTTNAAPVTAKAKTATVDKVELAKTELSEKRAIQEALERKAREKAEKQAQVAQEAKQLKAEKARKVITLAATEEPKATTPVAEVVQESGGDVDTVIQAAYGAIAQGQLGNALNHLRQLRDLNRVHPQIKRLAREIASRYHGHVRDLLAQGRGGDALPTLRAAKSVIMEFNLAEMNSAHDVLLHKVGSF